MNTNFRLATPAQKTSYNLALDLLNAALESPEKKAGYTFKHATGKWYVLRIRILGDDSVLVTRLFGKQGAGQRARKMTEKLNDAEVRAIIHTRLVHGYFLINQAPVTVQNSN